LCKTPIIGSKIKLENQEKKRIERLEKEKQELKMENIEYKKCSNNHVLAK